MSTLAVKTLLVWSEQVFVLTAAGAVAALAIEHPKARLWLWQVLLLILLLLPVIEPWAAPPHLVALEQTASSEIVTIQSAPLSPGFHWREDYWIWLIAAGAALRLMWVAAGLVRLRRYRMQASPLAAPPVCFASYGFAAGGFASEATGWYASDSVPGPVTYGGFFGWTRPVILLPARVLELPAETLEAIQCHELIHVRRGDWMFVLAEALVRSLLWFHPAIWFVLGRIQLTREQVVDREAVGLLQNRESYLDALVAVAGYRLQPDLTPAPSFLRKRHLAKRVNAVVKEINMSRSRIVAGVAAVCSALPLAAIAAMWLFPFVSPAVVDAQTAPDSPGITVEAGAALLHRAPVRVPQGFTGSGTVIVQATINAKGEVSDARVISGPEDLRKEILTSVLEWHYRPGPATTQISIRLEGQSTPGAATVAPAASVTSVAPVKGLLPAGGGRSGGPAPATPLYPGTIKSIVFLGISPEAEQDLRSRLPVREGDVINPPDVVNLNGVVREFDSHLSAVAVRTGGSGSASELTVQVRAQPSITFTAQAPPPPPPPPPSPTGQAQTGAAGGSIEVSPAVMGQKLISHVNPVYPPIAKQARIQGPVVLDAIVGRDGTMQNLRVLSAASPLLVQSAMDAVKQWVYQPTLLNGNPTEVETTITVNFTLQ